MVAIVTNPSSLLLRPPRNVPQQNHAASSRDVSVSGGVRLFRMSHFLLVLMFVTICFVQLNTTVVNTNTAVNTYTVESADTVESTDTVVIPDTVVITDTVVNTDTVENTDTDTVVNTNTKNVDNATDSVPVEDATNSKESIASSSGSDRESASASTSASEVATGISPPNVTATTVAFVVTITSCDGHTGKERYHAVDGAAVLSYSIHQNSIHGPKGGRYDYKLYAFYHTDAGACAAPLSELGYIVEARDTPILVDDIKNEVLRSIIVKYGCCGEKELIRFEAFTLVQYPIVVLVDVDTLLLKPIDRLFDFMLDPTKLPNPDDLLYVGKPAMAGMNTNVTVPQQIDILYTDDYPMVRAEHEPKGTQAGFTIIRPNRTIYDEIMAIVIEGDFDLHGGGGWGGRTGLFYGDTTFQGLIPYYFQILYPGRSLALNSCVWNNNNFLNREKSPDDPIGKCVTRQENCEDCRLRPIEDVGLIHFTLCYKPWFCYAHEGDDSVHNKNCYDFHSEWFKARSAMEMSWGRSGNGTGTFHSDLFLGYCLSGYNGEDNGYQKLKEPYGKPATYP